MSFAHGCYYLSVSGKRILIIEDEAPLAEALSYTLGREGFEVETEDDGARGLERFREGDYDLVVLDLMLPSMDGIEVCRQMRSSSQVPILILTAKDSDTDEIVGLEVGADDYVTKPFNTRKLIARLKALLRRAEPASDEPRTLERGALLMDLDEHEVYLEGEKVALTPLEFGILEALMKRPGKALSRETILNAAWEGGFYGSPKTLDVHIRHLREKIESDPANPRYIETVRSVGYRLGAPPGEGDRS